LGSAARTTETVPNMMTNAQTIADLSTLLMNLCLHWFDVTANNSLRLDIHLWNPVAAFYKDIPWVDIEDQNTSIPTAIFLHETLFQHKTHLLSGYHRHWNPWIQRYSQHFHQDAVWT
jgi:hypothetical protein